MVIIFFFSNLVFWRNLIKVCDCIAKFREDAPKKDQFYKKMRASVFGLDCFSKLEGGIREASEKYKNFKDGLQNVRHDEDAQNWIVRLAEKLDLIRKMTEDPYNDDQGFKS